MGSNLRLVSSLTNTSLVPTKKDETIMKCNKKVTLVGQQRVITATNLKGEKTSNYIQKARCSNGHNKTYGGQKPFNNLSKRFQKCGHWVKGGK